MERTESRVIQVSPDYENDRIQEMQMFGWNLQNRQEIHEEGDAEGRPALFGDGYVMNIKVKHYVKLHFARSLTLPNLDRIRKIEGEYESRPFPSPPSIKWPYILTGFFVLGVLIGNPQDPITARVVFGLLTAAGVYWIRSRGKKRTEAIAICQASVTRRAELLAEAQGALNAA